MIVRCVICGFDGLVTDYEAWSRAKNYPEIFICDVCYAEF